MNPTACSLDAEQLDAQLERYRAVGRLADSVKQQPGRIVVRFPDAPPSALIERTLEVERGCCPFLELGYDPATHSLVISADHPDRHPDLDAIAHALTESRATGVLPEGAQVETRTVAGTSCCSPAALETCCETQDKPDCCGEPASGGNMVAAPPSCGCRG